MYITLWNTIPFIYVTDLETVLQNYYYYHFIFSSLKLQLLYILKNYLTKQKLIADANSSQLKRI